MDATDIAAPHKPFYRDSRRTREKGRDHEGHALFYL
ncbi:hypothetical protein J2792_001618 [Novosphingobium capsulatum]|uniref:Uncharacterized protein n=1 Tax=Novosphingobium capsulatum TaxID=13688 RepID=A0ABU1ML42_9SPHN|nr:hypothetical protein [Novosphingobium sp. BK256]MBB3375363.1 hypothetical protein [Novosphingobium sp. BK280]MBB3379928.1 hypothetical protein [Novosphingobium sp. BK258]MBB3421623.1 hypothetical protein [Novosphingobium sp. BK267]MBB3449938.1 hypothetical protein [Novosphingobium sp. BK352]MBB3478637.1 hypothetical protein [Novosphingobium sp. BK369]MBB3501951.1 hypothetical protein [Novosphingobium sp. BK336]MBB3537888.1 hypothetical protein [Novosphingobium sp. BK486]MBB3557286.1 hypo